MTRSGPSLALLCVLAAAPACIGDIGDGDAPGSSEDALCEGIQPGPTHVRRLTANQYQNTIADVFGAGIDPGSTFPESEIEQGFRTNIAANIVTSSGAEGIETSAAVVSEQVTADLATFVGCDPELDGEPCVRTFVEQLGERLFRRPLATDEADRLTALYGTILSTEAATPRHGVRAIVEAMLQSPQFLYLAELGDPGAPPDQVVALTGHEIASRLSYLLWDTTPDTELLALAAEGSLEDSAVRRSGASSSPTRTIRSSSAA